jgi:hypothetical protein
VLHDDLHFCALHPRQTHSRHFVNVQGPLFRHRILISRDYHVLHLRRVQGSREPAAELAERGSGPRIEQVLRVILIGR